MTIRFYWNRDFRTKSRTKPSMKGQHCPQRQIHPGGRAYPQNKYLRTRALRGYGNNLGSQECDSTRIHMVWRKWDCPRSETPWRGMTTTSPAKALWLKRRAWLSPNWPRRPYRICNYKHVKRRGTTFRQMFLTSSQITILLSLIKSTTGKRTLHQGRRRASRTRSAPLSLTISSSAMASSFATKARRYSAISFSRSIWAVIWMTGHLIRRARRYFRSPILCQSFNK